MTSAFESDGNFRTFGSAVASGHGERSRVQLPFELGGTEHLSILAVDVSAVHALAVDCLFHMVSKRHFESVFFTPCNFKTLSCSHYTASYTRSPCFPRYTVGSQIVVQHNRVTACSWQPRLWYSMLATICLRALTSIFEQLRHVITRYC